MSGSQERTLTVTVTDDQFPFMTENRWYLHVAKTVINNEKPDSNVVWQTFEPSSITVVSWEPVYGFNWLLKFEEGGRAIDTEGEWVQCDFGQTLDLDATGRFVPGQRSGTPGLMTAGSNNWKPEAPGKLHIMIGLKDPSDGSWKPIYVDPITLGLHVSASYQPIEEVRWWYDSSRSGSSRVPQHKSPIATGEFRTFEDGFYKTSNYDPTAGEWITTNISRDTD